MLCSSLIEVLIWWIGCFLFVLNKILESHCLPKFYFDCLLVALSSSKWIIQWFLFDLYIFSSIDITKLCLPVSPGPWHDAQRCVELLNIDDVTFYALIFAGAKALRSKFSYFINLLFNQIHFLGMKIEMNELWKHLKDKEIYIIFINIYIILISILIYLKKTHQKYWFLWSMYKIELKRCISSAVLWLEFGWWMLRWKPVCSRIEGAQKD